MTLFAASIVTWQSCSVLPWHAPRHSSNFHPLSGYAIGCTSLPAGKLAVQVLPQSIPAGELPTTPLPTVLTDRVKSCTKLAVTVVLAVGVMTQVPVPLHPPPQPAKVKPLNGISLSPIWVPTAKFALQVEPHAMPEGELETMPPPELPTVSANFAVGANAALTLVSAVSVVTH